jgi:prepilin-type N-terminal cleavage/methylation domain-containing protein
MRLAPGMPRRGLSLLEVLVALAIFLLALGGISQLMTNATDRAAEVERRAQASRRCHSKLNELLAGVTPLQAENDVPFDDDPSYTWSVEVNPGAATGLSIVTVRVSRPSLNNNGQKFEVALSQMILDPSMFGSTQDASSIAGSTGSGDPTTSGSSSGSSGSGSSGAATGGTTAASTPATTTGSTGSMATKTTGTTSTGSTGTTGTPGTKTGTNGSSGTKTGGASKGGS